MSVTVSYNTLSRNIERSLATTANSAQVKLESKYYLEHYNKITTIENFINDTRSFTFAMTAFGLEDLAFAKGYMRKVLEEGVTDARSLANRTNDPKIKEFAETFDFQRFGTATMGRSAAGQAVVDRFVRQTMETEAGRNDGDGVRLALYFERTADKIENAYDVLADKALSKVVRVALGLPAAFSAADIDKQAAVLAKRIDFTSFADPIKLKRFLTRFTAQWDATEGLTRDPILALFARAGTTSRTVSVDLAVSLATLRLGGV